MPKWYIFYAAMIVIIAAYQPVIADADRFMFLGVERDLFEIVRAEAWFLFILFIYLMFPEKIITQIAFIAFSGNVMDELFFNPYEIQYFEYIIPALWIGFKTTQNYVKKRNNKPVH